MILGLLGWMFYIDWLFALAALLMASAMLLIMRLVTVRLQEITMGSRSNNGSLTKCWRIPRRITRWSSFTAVREYENQRMRKRRRSASLR